MKRKLFLMFGFITIFYLSMMTKPAHTFSSSPPPSNTGAPSHATCGTNGECHVNATASNLNDENGSVEISFGEDNTTYEAGQTYDMTITISHPSASRFGFQMVAFNANNESVGNFVGNMTNFTESKLGGDGIQYIQHANIPESTNNTYSFEWEAPATMTDDITFYVSCMAANANSSPSGDFIYTNSLAVTPLVDTNLEQLNANITLYPNPVQDILNIQIPQNEITGELQLMDATGKVIEVFNTNTTQIDLSNQATGIYFLQIPTTSQNITKKLIVR